MIATGFGKRLHHCSDSHKDMAVYPGLIAPAVASWSPVLYYYMYPLFELELGLPAQSRSKCRLPYWIKAVLRNHDVRMHLNEEWNRNCLKISPPHPNIQPVFGNQKVQEHPKSRCRHSSIECNVLDGFTLELTGTEAFRVLCAPHVRSGARVVQLQAILGYVISKARADARVYLQPIHAVNMYMRMPVYKSACINAHFTYRHVWYMHMH